MISLVWALDERLANPGDTLAADGRLDWDSYELGDHAFRLPEGISYELMLTNAGEGILVTGMMHAHVEGSCDRCLEEASFDVDGEVDEYFLFAEPTREMMGDDDDVLDFSLVGADRTIDITDALHSALVMETPFVVLCREDCKGLCPVCGTNLNEHDCGHAEELEARREQERRAASPFAVLEDITFD